MIAILNFIKEQENVKDNEKMAKSNRNGYFSKITNKKE